MHSRRGSGIALRALECAGLTGHRPDRVPAHLPLCAKSSGEILLLAPHHHGQSEGFGRSSHPFLARRSHRSAATAGARWRVGQHGGWGRDSCGSPVRTSRRWTTRRAGGDGARSAPSGEHHAPGDAGNLAGQFRSRCNRSHGPGPEIMNLWRKLACVALAVVVCASLAANWLAPVGYEKQYREATNAPPSRAHWLGTDELGRDRFARVLYGTRISLLLAPAAALLSTLMAAFIGGLAGYLGGIWARLAMAVTDLFLSLPWLFLLITARAFMPLNVSPLISVLVTFLLLGLLGWSTAARVLCATAGSLRSADFVRQARAAGVPGSRLFWIHVMPNLKPVLYAQFWISIPVFILSEANLGILGLGVAEPMPSWGSLLRELEGLVSLGDEPWKFVPLLLLVVVVMSFQLLLSSHDEVAA